ncbi:MAG: hypothetical protein ACI4JQ_03960 [Ruminococcus sp.]
MPKRLCSAAQKGQPAGGRAGAGNRSLSKRAVCYGILEGLRLKSSCGRASDGKRKEMRPCGAV